MMNPDQELPRLSTHCVQARHDTDSGYCQETATQDRGWTWRVTIDGPKRRNLRRGAGSRGELRPPEFRSETPLPNEREEAIRQKQEHRAPTGCVPKDFQHLASKLYPETQRVECDERD